MSVAMGVLYDSGILGARPNSQTRRSIVDNLELFARAPESCAIIGLILATPGPFVRSSNHRKERTLQFDSQRVAIVLPLQMHDLRALCSSCHLKTHEPPKTSTTLRSSIPLIPSSAQSLTRFWRRLFPERRRFRYRLLGKYFSSQTESRPTSGTLQYTTKDVKSTPSQDAHPQGVTTNNTMTGVTKDDGSHYFPRVPES